MSNKKLPGQFVEYLCIALISILLLIISKGEWIAGYPLIAFLLKELGFAGLVAIVLVFSVERISRKRHEVAADELVDRINENLFHAIYKKYIPEKVFAEVEKCLMQSKVFRTGHELTYTIDELAGSDYLLCKAQTRYTLINQLDSEIEHDVVIRLEAPVDPAFADQCSVSLVEINNICLTNEELVQGTSHDRVHVSFRRKIKIPASGKVEIHTCLTLVKARIDSEVWASRVPSDGLTLTVSTPAKNIRVDATANHMESLRHTLKNEVTNTWRLNYGIFPFQSIVFWWKPAEKPADSAKEITAQ